MKGHEMDKASFYKHEDTYRFRYEDYDIELNEETLLLYAHRQNNLYDTVAVIDTRDQDYWFWTRMEYGEEFPGMEAVARTVGSVLLRTTPLENIEQIVHNRISPRDEHFEEFYE